jgi:hypothetical protein
MMGTSGGMLHVALSNKIDKSLRSVREKAATHRFRVGCHDVPTIESEAVIETVCVSDHFPLVAPIYDS